MVSKEELHLGQRVWYGADRKECVVDGLTQTFAGLVISGERGYVYADYGQIYDRSV